VARVITIAQSVRDLAGGLDRFEVDAPTVRALLSALDARHPGLAAHVREAMVIAIDGELHHDAWEAPLSPDSEVVLIPMIAGG
jgi:molybdopterin converting factor small subunit